MPGYAKHDLPRFFQRGLDAPPRPILEDLLRLCQEEEVDDAILKQDFPGKHEANNGKVFMYDCRKLK